MPKTYEPIATTTLGSNETSVVFSSIPSTYTDLIFIIEGYNGVGNGYYPRFYFNADTGSNYSYSVLEGNGTTAGSSRGSNATRVLLGWQYAPWTTNSANRGNIILHIFNYANTTTNKTSLSRSNTPSDGVNATASLWRSTAAINTVTFVGDTGISQSYASGSTFTLYGIKAA
jgi:hypothetical protein